LQRVLNNQLNLPRICHCIWLSARKYGGYVLQGACTDCTGQFTTTPTSGQSNCKLV